MARIAIDWAAYDLREKAFEQALAEGNATLVDHPLPSGGVLAATRANHWRLPAI
jgi:hypothetical protein